MKHIAICLSRFILISLLVIACANPGSPDGGPWDETPPHIVSSIPKAYATNQKSKRITLQFNEHVKLNNAAEKVIISPPQLEMPDIRANGSRISVDLKDDLSQSTTYTIDFGDAIEDNNEGNPMGEYAFVFSTGEQIDTLQISGHVLEASNLEPIKGILVGLQSDTTRSAFREKAFDRVGRTNGSGRFTIKGIAPGSYRIYALNDADGDFRFGQKSEKIAFLDQLVVPSFEPALRNDTLWADSVRIDTIRQVEYTRFLPDDVVLRAFTEPQTDRHLLKTERPDHTRFTLYFTASSTEEPNLRGLNFNSDSAFLIDKTIGNDTLTYWLRDTNLVKMDTLEIALTYDETNDSTGIRHPRTDTLDLTPKISYAKVLEKRADELKEWEKQMEKRKKNVQRTAPKKPRQVLNIANKSGTGLNPMNNPNITFSEPLAQMDTSLMRLQLRVDTNWVDVPYLLEKDEGKLLSYSLYGEWRSKQEYRFVADSAAFHSIYQHTNNKFDANFNISSDDSFGSLFINAHGTDTAQVIIQLLNTADRPIRSITSTDGHADFYYLSPGSYFMRIIIDRNRNGVWDTGDYDKGLQPEEVYYYPGELVVRARWDIEQDWYITNTALTLQKPAKITKQKPDQKKRIQNRNAEREREKR